MLRTFNDTHLGNSASSHTTRKSSKALDRAIFDTALGCATAAKGRNDTIIHGGDLFHRFSNNEEIILQGIEIAKYCDAIVGANHDLSNRDNARSSIEIVDTVHNNVIMACVNEIVVEEFTTSDGINIVVVPHHSSQDLFDKALARVSSGDLLFLHCNYNSPFAHNDASLNLTPEQAELLLKKVNYIVLSHEHNPRTELDGRLIVTGNTHPTNFGDISDKYYYEYTKDSGFTKHLVWSKTKGYRKVNVEEFLSGGIDYTDVNFIEVVGNNVKREFSADISKEISRVWSLELPNLYMIRNNINFVEMAGASIDEAVKLESITKAITDNLADNKELKAVWQNYLNKVEE